MKTKFVGKLAVSQKAVCVGRYIHYSLRFCAWDSEHSYLRTVFSFEGQGCGENKNHTYAFRLVSTPSIDDFEFPQFLKEVSKLKKGMDKQNFPAAALDFDGKPMVVQNDLARIIEAAKKIGYQVKHEAEWEWVTTHPEREVSKLSVTS